MTTATAPAPTLRAPEADRRVARRTLLTIFLVCLAPVLASYTAFYLWRPGKLRVHGELVQPPVPVDWSAYGAAAQPLRGKWVLIWSSPASCDQTCRTRLYDIRQVRTALGQDMERVARAWLVTGDGAPARELLAQHAGVTLLHAQGTTPLSQESGRILLIDPLGNLMLRFPAEPDAKLMLKDLQRLLKYSPAGTR